MTRSGTPFGMAAASAVVLALVGAVACGPRLSSHSSEVLDQLGKATGFSGTDCPSAQAMVDAYLEEIGRRPSRALSATVPKFARRSVGVCPQSHPIIRISEDVDAAAIRRMLGGPVSSADDPIQIESWLRADVDHGKVVSLTLDLAKVSR
jgi:hypothetical protein